MKKNTKIVCGLTHVDLGWKKTRQEMEEVFETYIIKLLDLCEQYPDFTYMLEQAYHYRGLKKRRPDLMAKLVPLVKSGRLRFATALASTIENNVTCGESFIRNMHIGRRFIEREFGVTVKDCAMIDTFGFPPQMPQVLSQMGYRRLLANRLGAYHSEDVMHAVGLDGTRILVAGSDLLAYRVNPGHVNFRYFLNYADQKRLFEDVDKNDVPIQLVIPYSENEVTPCRLIPEIVHANKDKYHFGHLDEFFDALEASNSEYPEVSADLNPEFTGTFSMRQHLRLENRKAEVLLLEAEKLSALCKLNNSEEIEDCWWTLSYVQFHDVLTGSHPTAVYYDCLNLLDEVCNTAKSIIEHCISDVSSPAEGVWSIWNGLPYSRNERITVALPECWKGASAAELDGREVAVSQDKNGNAVVNLTLSPMKTHRLKLIEGKYPEDVCTISKDSMENEWIRVEFDSQSMIARLIYKPTGYVFMENVQDLLVFQKDNGNFQIECPIHGEISTAVGKYQCRRYCENGVDIAEIEGFIDDNVGVPVPYTIKLSLAQDTPALGISVHVNWHSEGARLRLKINTCMNASVNTYEVPFGAAERKPYVGRFNSRGEWAAQRFVCMEAPWDKKGIALINRGIVGVEAANGVLYSTLLRAPITEYAGMIPDDTSSDHGEHDFEFLLVPYDGCRRNSPVLKLAEQFNNPPIVCSGKARNIHQKVLVQGNAALSAIVNTHLGDTAVRVYEPYGQGTEISIALPENCQAWHSDLNQERGESISIVEGKIKLQLKPFEIKTIVFSQMNN